MGTTFKRGKKWGISYYDPNGRQVRKLVSPYKETAQKILAKVEVEIAEGKYLDKKEQKKVLFEDFAVQYFNSYVRMQNKNAGNQKKFIDALIREFKGMHLHQIDTLTIRNYLAKRAQTLRPSSVNKYLTMVKSMYNRAIEWGIWLKANPAAGIKKMPENNERYRWLTEEEQERLLSRCSGMARFIVMIALKTGMRWGEIINLKWQQTPNSNYIDFDSNTIVIHQSQSKTQRSRFIPLGAALRAALQQIPRYTDSEYIFWNPAKKRQIRSISGSFKNALKKAGISDFKFHDLRHTFASQLVKSGVDLYVVQKLLGHSNPKMTQRYAHLHPAQLQMAIEVIDGKVGVNQFETAKIAPNDKHNLSTSVFRQKSRLN